MVTVTLIAPQCPSFFSCALVYLLIPLAPVDVGCLLQIGWKLHHGQEVAAHSPSHHWPAKWSQHICLYVFQQKRISCIKHAKNHPVQFLFWDGWHIDKERRKEGRCRVVRWPCFPSLPLIPNTVQSSHCTICTTSRAPTLENRYSILISLIKSRKVNPSSISTQMTEWFSIKVRRK